jgi:hypothetical protein
MAVVGCPLVAGDASGGSAGVFLGVIFLVDGGVFLGVFIFGGSFGDLVVFLVGFFFFCLLLGGGVGEVSA